MDFIIPMRVIYEELVQTRFLQSRKGKAVREERLNKGYCQYHVEVQEHVIQECIEFRDIVQNLMDRKEIEFSKSNNPSIDVITGTTYSMTLLSTGPRSIIIFHDNEATRDEMPKVSTPVLVVEVPRPFPYKSQKVVPWDYNCNYTDQTTTTDLICVGGITRSRRCYAPDMIEKVTPEKLLMPAS